MEEKYAICYTCCGPSYRETARNKLINHYIDKDNIFYFVITDNKEYFSDIKRKNLVVRELKDFYDEYPYLEKYEYFLESSDKDDYGKKFFKLNYRYPFSVNRFNLLIAKEYNIKNVALLGTDSDLKIDNLNLITEKNNIIYNLVSVWNKKINEKHMNIVADILKNDYNLKTDDNITIYDAACKLFCFENVEFMIEFFNLWNDIMLKLYDKGLIKLFSGPYAVNNEYILGPIYNAIGIKGPKKYINRIIMDVKHNPKKERYWMTEEWIKKNF